MDFARFGFQNDTVLDQRIYSACAGTTKRDRKREFITRNTLLVRKYNVCVFDTLAKIEHFYIQDSFTEGKSAILLAYDNLTLLTSNIDTYFTLTGISPIRLYSD